MKLQFVFCCVFFLFICKSAEADKKSSLRLVQILFRHGDRAPINLYPNDPIPESVWPEGLAKLTMLGRKQHYAFGKYLRNMYKDFASYSPLEVEVLSSSVDRCLRSAETNLASFFAPGVNWTFNENFNWQPIPIQYVPKEKDKYLETDSDCPQSSAEQKRLVNSPDGQKFLNKHRDMLKNLTLLSGKDLANWTQASYLRDTLLIEKKYNYSVPSWVDPFWEELNYVADMSFFLSFNSPLMHRLRAGPLFQKFIEKMNDKIEGKTPDIKFYVYSAHDTNIAVLLGALNLFSFKAPPYCSALIFELHQLVNGTHAIRLLYQNSTQVEKSIQPPHVLKIEGCGEYCPLEYFVSYTKEMIPEDWEEECQLEKTLVEKIQEKQLTLGWFLILIAVVISTMSVFAVWKIYRRREDKGSVSESKYTTLR